MLNFYFLKSLLQIIIIIMMLTKYIVCLPSAVTCNLSNTVVFISSLLHIFFIQRSFIVSNLGPADVLQGKVKVTVLHPQNAPG